MDMTCGRCKTADVVANMDGRSGEKRLEIGERATRGKGGGTKSDAQESENAKSSGAHGSGFKA